jgi:hypothetical protein
MTAITLESDSSHSPPFLHKSNGRSSRQTPENQGFCRNVVNLCEDSRTARRIIPRSTGATRC